MVPLKLIVKLVPAVLAVIAMPPTRVASVLLHVVAAIVRESSAVNRI